MSETRGLLLLYTVHGPIHYYWSTNCIGSLNVNVCLLGYLLTTHSGSKWQKLARNRFITVCLMWFQPNFHNFRFRWLLALHFQNLSNCCRQFHRGFFQLNFWRYFCYLTQLYYAARFRAFQRFTAWFLPAFGRVLLLFSVATKTFTENWVIRQSFIVLILTTA